MVAILRFCFRKIASKMLDFQNFLFQKVPLVGILSKTRTLISRTYVAKQQTNLPILSEALKICWSHSGFAWEKYP